VEPSIFEDVADVLRGTVPRGLGELHCQPRRWGLKAWFDSVEPPREHYEAQVIGARYCPAATTLALEIGFHAEHKEAAANQAVLDRLLDRQAKWRKALGPEAEAGAFLGRAERWRRVSETWPDPDLRGTDMVIEIAVRLADYITALEPFRPLR
jgi:hypothetical protein